MPATINGGSLSLLNNSNRLDITCDGDMKIAPASFIISVEFDDRYEIEIGQTIAISHSASDWPEWVTEIDAECFQLVTKTPVSRFTPPIRFNENHYIESVPDSLPLSVKLHAQQTGEVIDTFQTQVSKF